MTTIQELATACASHTFIGSDNGEDVRTGEINSEIKLSDSYVFIDFTYYSGYGLYGTQTIEDLTVYDSEGDARSLTPEDESLIIENIEVKF